MWQTLHTDMLDDFAVCRKMEMPETEQVEWAWKIASRYWQQVKEIYKDYVFTECQKEVAFYKVIKPAFTGYIEFFSILHEALELHGGQEKSYSFWQHEYRRLEQFSARHREFVEYYVSGRTCYDLQYFTAGSYSQDYVISGPYDIDGNCISSHDHLVASLLGEEMYHGYVKEKLAYQ